MGIFYEIFTTSEEGGGVFMSLLETEPMIVSKKSQKNLSDYIQFLLKKIEFNKKREYF